MIFRTIEHYNNIIHIDSLTDLTIADCECFICFRNVIQNNEIPIKLKEQSYYEKTCDCDGWVHSSCINLWYEQSKKCPICRKDIHKKSLIYFTIFNETSCLTIYMFIHRTSIMLIKFLYFIFFFYFFIDFYIKFYIYSYNKN